MKKIDVGQTVNILANLGVIAGILLLALELQQNNELLEAQARYSQSDRAMGFADHLLEPNIATLLVRVQHAEELSDEEEIQLFGLGLRVLRSWEWQFHEFRAGTLADLNTASWRSIFRGEAEVNYRLSETWVRAKPVLDPDFLQFFEQNVVNER